MVRWEFPSEVRTICKPVKIRAMRDLHCRPADIVRDLELGSIKQNQGVL